MKLTKRELYIIAAGMLISWWVDKHYGKDAGDAGAAAAAVAFPVVPSDSVLA